MQHTTATFLSTTATTMASRNIVEYIPVSAADAVPIAVAPRSVASARSTAPAAAAAAAGTALTKGECLLLLLLTLSSILSSPLPLLHSPFYLHACVMPLLILLLLLVPLLLLLLFLGQIQRSQQVSARKFVFVAVIVPVASFALTSLFLSTHVRYCRYLFCCFCLSDCSCCCSRNCRYSAHNR